MKSGVARWGAIIIGGGAVAAMIFWWFSSRDDTRRRVALPDGTVLSLKKASFGSVHDFHYGTFWQKLLWRRAPSLAGRLKINRPAEAFNNTPTPALCLFFHRTAAPTNSWTEDAMCMVCDESGVEYGRSGGGSAMLLTPGPRSSSGERIEMRVFDAFPRRSKTLLLRIYSWSRIDSSHIPLMDAGEIRIPNPAHEPYPVWTSESLPATRPAGDLEVALTRLEAVVDPTEKLRFHKKDLRTGTRAVYRITRNSEPTSAWRAESLRLSDATGNSLYLWAGDQFPRDAGGLIRSQWRLGLDEPAWKVRMEISHCTDYAPGDLCTLADVPVNSTGTKAGPPFQASIRGTNIVFTQLRRESNWGGNANVEVRIVPKTESFRIALVKVTDDREREIEIRSPPAGYGDFQGPSHYFGLQLPADSKTLNLTFACQESRFVEFTAKPDEIILREAH